MYQDIKVEWIEDATTKTNRPYKKLAVLDESGKKYNVNIFSDFPEFASITLGSVIRGKLEPNGQYTNLVSETQSKGKFGASGGYKQAQIEKVMDKKNESIGKFQDSKELSIKIASTMNKAVELAIATKDVTEDSMADNILFWRKWMWEHWDVDVKDFPPFN